MINLAIVGADSFIASKFIESFFRHYKLKLFSRKATEVKNTIVKDNLNDITSKDFFGCDCVINFAAIVHQPHLQDTNLYYQVNTELPHNLATKAKEAGVKHFIQLSTIAVYENTGRISSNTAELPNTIYGKSKLKGDRLLLGMKDESFDVSIVRPPMVYGGGKAPGNLQKIINFAQKGIPLPFKGVENKRDFVHVGNLIQALNTLIENMIYGIVIPTDRKPVSTCEIISYIKKHSNKKIRNIKIPGIFLQIIKKIKPNIYSKVFGNLRVDCNLPDSIYKPKYSMEDGIREMIEAVK